MYESLESFQEYLRKYDLEKDWKCSNYFVKMEIEKSYEWYMELAEQEMLKMGY